MNIFLNAILTFIVSTAFICGGSFAKTSDDYNEVIGKLVRYDKAVFEFYFFQEIFLSEIHGQRASEIDLSEIKTVAKNILIKSLFLNERRPPLGELVQELVEEAKLNPLFLGKSLELSTKLETVDHSLALLKENIPSFVQYLPVLDLQKNSVIKLIGVEKNLDGEFPPDWEILGPGCLVHEIVPYNDARNLGIALAECPRACIPAEVIKPKPIVGNWLAFKDNLFNRP